MSRCGGKCISNFVIRDITVFQSENIKNHLHTYLPPFKQRQLFIQPFSHFCKNIFIHFDQSLYMLLFPDFYSAEEAMKILKILQNPKAPMVKKRQAMRNTFGDYRKKMAEEERKHATSK